VNYISGRACLFSSCYPLVLPLPVPRCAFEKRAAALQPDAYRALIGRRCCEKSCRFRPRLPAHYSPYPTPTWPGQWRTVLRSYFSFFSCITSVTSRVAVRDVYPGSKFFHPGSGVKSIPEPRIPNPDPHQRIKVFLTLKLFLSF
jgi:hypothetical protein